MEVERERGRGRGRGGKGAYSVKHRAWRGRERDGEIVRARERERKGIIGSGRSHRYRGPSLIRNRRPLGPYRRPMPRVLGRVLGGGGRFLMGEVPQYFTQGLRRNTSGDSIKLSQSRLNHIRSNPTMSLRNFPVGHRNDQMPRQPAERNVPYGRKLGSRAPCSPSPRALTTQSTVVQLRLATCLEGSFCILGAQFTYWWQNCTLRTQSLPIVPGRSNASAAR